MTTVETLVSRVGDGGSGQQPAPDIFEGEAMESVAEVQLQFAGHNEEVDAEPWRDFLAWLLAEPGPSGGLSGAPVVRTSGTGVEVVALAITIGSALEARDLADSLVMRLKRRNGDVTVKLTVPVRQQKCGAEPKSLSLTAFSSR
jgi:hypothetical protein